MKRFVGLILAAGMLAGCAAPVDDTPAPTPTSTTTTTTTSTTTTSTTPTSTSKPEVDVREQVARMLMPGVVNYADAKAKLHAGVGGIFITSWADPNLLYQIEELRKEIGRPFDVAIDFEGGRVQRFSEILGAHPSPRELAATMSVEQVEAKAY